MFQSESAKNSAVEDVANLDVNESKGDTLTSDK